MRGIHGSLILGLATGAAGVTLSPVAADAAKLTTLYSFTGLADGAAPVAGLIYVNGALYGTTLAGGEIGGDTCADGCGTVFKVDPTTGAETVIHAFTSVPDGAFPVAGLIYKDGLLYGTTGAGGTAKCPDSDTGCGTVFKLDPTTGVETVIYNFKNGGRNGLGPAAGVIYDSGILYGTAAQGGRGGAGTVFAVNAKTGAGTRLWAFKGQTDGETPLAGLISHAGTLYGTTAGLEQPTYRGTVFGWGIPVGRAALLQRPAVWHDGGRVWHDLLGRSQNRRRERGI
jgi:uncharacterized repeat protein (TIGR03803 family)